MPHTPSHNTDFSQVLQQAFARLLDGEGLEAFCNWFSQAALASEQGVGSLTAQHVSSLSRLQRHLARHLWGLMPMPANRWRARGVPKVERNAPCYCGSGKKFKQCCAEFEHAPFPLGTDEMLVTALEGAEAKWLTGEHLRHVPAQALGMAALNWNDAGLETKTLALLGPLFDEPSRLDERHETALDALLEALLNLGQDDQRRLLLDRLVGHANKVLATAARSRLVSVLADRGEEDKAWALFHELSRFNPNDPQLWGLELTLLLTQGRQEEARLRAPLLAARARKSGLDDLAASLLQMAQDGIASAYENRNDEVDDPEDLEWLELMKAVPTAIDPATLQSLYKVSRYPMEEDGESFTLVSLQPDKKQADLNTRWRRKFLVGKPEMTWLEGDVDCLLGSLPEALAFMQKNPTAWLSAEVLDGLLLAALELCEDDVPGPVLKAARRLAKHAMAVLSELVGEAQLHWIELAHRPLLRCLALAIELARQAHDDTGVVALLRQGLSLNPHDNHGWRGILAPMLIAQGHHEEALALMARYPGDMPPSEHLRSMALLGMGQKTEAETVLRAAHEAYPLFLNTLLPERMTAPPEEPGPGLLMGGATAAWYHRLEWRALWVRSGALAWARELQLPEPAPAKSRKPPKVKKTTKSAPPPAAGRPANKDTISGAKGLSKPFDTKALKTLQKICSDYPRLHGLMLAVAWSPQMVMPNAWLQAAMPLLDRMPNTRTEATTSKAQSEAMNATMQLYNHVNQEVLDHFSDAMPPLEGLLKLVVLSDAAVFSCAAGFAQGAELSAAAWARQGHKVTGNTGAFGRLRGLAARAVVQGGQARFEHDGGAPLLQEMDVDAPPPQISLIQALAELWPTVIGSRRSGST